MSLEVQVTRSVMFSVVRSSNSPTATSGAWPPTATDGSAGAMAIVTNMADDTVMVASPEKPMYCAVIVAGPAATVLTSPLLACASLTAAVPGADDVQVASA